MLRCSVVVYLFQAEDNVGIVIHLIGVQRLSVIPEEISISLSILTQTHQQVQGLTSAHPQGSVGPLEKHTGRSLT